LEAVRRQLDAERYTLALNFPTPSLGTLTASISNYKVFIIGHCPARVSAGPKLVLLFQAKYLSSHAYRGGRCDHQIKVKNGGRPAMSREF
jgi:hypothetical protein